MTEIIDERMLINTLVNIEMISLVVSTANECMREASIQFVDEKLSPQKYQITYTRVICSLHAYIMVERVQHCY